MKTFVEAQIESVLMREVQLMIEQKQKSTAVAQNKYVVDDVSEEDSWAIPSPSQQKPTTQ